MLYAVTSRNGSTFYTDNLDEALENMGNRSVQEEYVEILSRKSDHDKWESIMQSW